jgi:hypothetical protein
MFILLTLRIYLPQSVWYHNYLIAPNIQTNALHAVLHSPDESYNSSYDIILITST